jgi:predicted molibdopterin-dependent oxidoreductase YjgC
LAEGFLDRPKQEREPVKDLGKMVRFRLNNESVYGDEGQYVLQVAEKHGFQIPTLCHFKGLEPAGLCRLCTVEVHDRNRVRFVTACNYPIAEGLEVYTDTKAVLEIRKMIVELLLARCANAPIIQSLARQYGIEKPRFKREEHGCILCGLCVRICEKIGVNAITLVGRGMDLKVETPYEIVSDLCIGCGSCAYICPTAYIRSVDVGDERMIYMEDRVINQFKLEKCPQCGNPYTTKAHLNYLREYVDLAMGMRAEHNLCPECARKARAVAMIGQLQR